MVIVAGHITDEPRQRDSYVAGCKRVVDPGRVNIFERWESQAAVETFRRSGPAPNKGAAMLLASVAEYDIADVRSLLKKM